MAKLTVYNVNILSRPMSLNLTILQQIKLVRWGRWSGQSSAFKWEWIYKAEYLRIPIADVVVVFSIGPAGICAVVTDSVWGPSVIFSVDRLDYRVVLGSVISPPLTGIRRLLHQCSTAFCTFIWRWQTWWNRTRRWSGRKEHSGLRAGISQVADKLPEWMWTWIFRVFVFPARKQRPALQKRVLGYA